MNIGDVIRIKTSSNPDRVGVLAIILSTTIYSKECFLIHLLNGEGKDRYHQSRLEKIT